MTQQEAMVATTIFLRFADGTTGITPVMPRYLAETMAGHLNVSQHWEGKRLVGIKLNPLSFVISEREQDDD